MELNIKVDMKGALLKGMAPEIINNNLEVAITKATELLENEVIKRTPQGVGGNRGSGLMNNIHGEVVQKGIPIVKGVVFHSMKYGDVIEKGRLSGKGIPEKARGALIQWVNVKLGIEGKQAERVAFLISRKIKQHGFEGRHMFENALKENMGRIDDIFTKVGLDIAKELSE